MKLVTDYRDAGVHVNWLNIELKQYEHVTITLPSGHRVDVFDDCINVAGPEVHHTRDGKRVWTGPRRAL
jgi:hypothetical protein